MLCVPCLEFCKVKVSHSSMCLAFERLLGCVQSVQEQNVTELNSQPGGFMFSPARQWEAGREIDVVWGGGAGGRREKQCFASC